MKLLLILPVVALLAACSTTPTSAADQKRTDSATRIADRVGQRLDTRGR